MAYSAEISRSNPSCFLFLIDRSGSMDDAFGAGDSTRKKADGVADAINRLLQNLVINALNYRRPDVPASEHGSSQAVLAARDGLRPVGSRLLRRH